MRTSATLERVLKKEAIMFFKKKSVIITLSILFIIVAALGSVFVISRLDKGAQQKGNEVTSRHFNATLPEGSKLTNDNKTHNVYATSNEAYGELRVSIVRSSLNVTQLVQRGDIIKADTTVDGVNVTKQTIDYAKAIRGSSDKLLMRYEVAVNEIPKPSEKEYTNVSVVAFSKRALTATEKNDVAKKSDDILRSLEIK